MVDNSMLLHRRLGHANMRESRESLNVTLDESLPKPKSSSLIEDDRIDEPIVQDLNGSPSLKFNVSDEGYPKSLKDARGHPIKQVIGNGYPRKGQKSKPIRQNRARERKEHKEKSRSKASQKVKVKSKSNPG
ncbi:hypothetical protein Tco_0273213 [Tanacetum coccineum]